MNCKLSDFLWKAYRFCTGSHRKEILYKNITYNFKSFEVKKHWTVKGFGSVAAAVGSMGFFTQNVKICISIMTLGFGFLAAVNSGHLKSIIDLSRKYSGTVYGFSNGFGCIAGFLSPLVTGYVTESDPGNPAKWQIVNNFTLIYCCDQLYITLCKTNI